ncbi:LOW QUALITY PROTEIN: BAG family molecular chaperone regulator 8, chloroplastic [Neltuma alba]|uniref:LOW QUALITY PROTEIN: BAG family molecular chaperone regulator 8, chloroplastic n=1 Tax=Neltuma alba TaxID=207710 RepID=UPI0010A518B2|nr:LOW QUALITY PROTEIN: BAG family molecular chaperone regulator 8, chloroplastic [Prosopis alba]
MASYCPNHPSHPCHQQPPPLPTASAHCYCNHPPYSCPSPPPSTDQLLQAIASLLGQFDPVPPNLYTQCDQSEAYRFLNQNKYHKYSSKNRLRQHEQQSPSAIASLLCRIEALESSLHYFSSSSSHGCRPSLNYSLRDTAARVIQTHFRAFLVRRSRTLRQLKELGCIKSRFNALKSLLSNAAHVDYAALSREVMDLLLQLDSIECCDPMVRDGKGSISRDLGHFLDSIEGVAVKKHLRLVKATKNARFGQNLDKSRVLNSKHGVLGRDQRRLLENLRGRVDRISRLCKLSAKEEGDVKSEGSLHIIDDTTMMMIDDDPSIVIRRRTGASPTNNGVFVQRQEIQRQPRTKKSVSFAESGSVSKIYSNTCEPALSEDATCLDGSSSSDEQEEILENIRSEVEDVLDSSRGAEVDEEAILDNGGSAQSSDGEKSSKRHLKNDCKNEGKVIFTAPLPLKMETRGDLTKSKGVRILT